MRGNAESTRFGDEVLCVVGLLGAHKYASRTHLLPLIQHQQGDVSFCTAVSLRGHAGGDHTDTILDQRMTQICQLRLLAVALLGELRLRIGDRLMSSI